MAEEGFICTSFARTPGMLFTCGLTQGPLIAAQNLHGSTVVGNN